MARLTMPGRDKHGIDYGELDLEGLVRFLIDTGNASLESKIPDREPLQWAVDKLGKFCAAIKAVDQSNHLSPAHKRAARRSLVLGALAAAFEIGSHGTVSKNTDGYIKAVVTAPGRSKLAEKREPSDKRIREAIQEAEKKYPPGFRGRMTAIDNEVVHKVGGSAKTASRHRKKMRTR
jgi:hypothetical protein